MKFRRLGREGPEVSAIGMGRGATPVQYDTPLETDFNASIARGLELGINHFDSGDDYWDGRHEVLLGRALGKQRRDVLVTSKFGNVTLSDGKKGANGRPDYLRQCCDISLKRLGTDVIDIYYMHRVDQTVPIEETIGAMGDLVRAGKIRHVGVCETGVNTLRRAHAEHPVTVLQTEYSLWARDVEDGILSACSDLGIGFIGYAPLGRGLLTGKIRTVDDIPEGDRRHRHPRFQDKNLEHNMKLVAGLESVAASIGATPAQTALAWVLAQGDFIVPIPGTNRVANVDLNVAAAELELPSDTLSKLSDLFKPGSGAGTRYNESQLKGMGL